MLRHGACMHASTFEVCFIYHQGLSVIAQEALTVEAPVSTETTSGALVGINSMPVGAENKETS